MWTDLLTAVQRFVLDAVTGWMKLAPKYKAKKEESADGREKDGVDSLDVGIDEFYRDFQIIRNPGGGHCMYHAFCRALDVGSAALSRLDRLKKRGWSGECSVTAFRRIVVAMDTQEKYNNYKVTEDAVSQELGRSIPTPRRRKSVVPEVTDLDTFRDSTLVEVASVRWGDERAMDALCEELGVTVLLLDLWDGVKVRPVYVGM